MICLLRRYPVRVVPPLLAFHSRMLYPHLAFSISYLLQDLMDSGE